MCVLGKSVNHVVLKCHDLELRSAGIMDEINGRGKDTLIYKGFSAMERPINRI